MDPMKELITLEQANKAMLSLLVIAPVAGLAWGFLRKKIIEGLAWGIGIGVGVYGLWRIYNAITDHFGLDTVKNLVINLVLFTTLGIVGGIAYAAHAERAARRARAVRRASSGGEAAVRSSEESSG